MKKIILFPFLIFTIAIIVSSCCKKHHDNISNSKKMTTVQAGPPVYIYKTRADYSKYVPVILSSDKKSIVSFPGIHDLTYKGELAYPTKLNGGYLLDNRGINKDAAFLSITYEEYSLMAKTPTPVELMTKILDTDPFTELYYCGTRFDYKELESELNQLIEKQDFSRFRKEK
ncbi:MAG: hypothetical protein AB9842_06130 [Bacteroidales bacterium]